MNRNILTLLSAAWLAWSAGVCRAEEPERPAQLTLDDLRTFTDVFEQIRRNYIDEIDDATLLDAAIHGMVGATDGYSSFIDENEFRALQQNTRGEAGGIGATVMIQKRLLVVQSVHRSGPADRAGMRAGDVITDIDGEPVRGRRLAEAIDALEGAPGSAVALGVLRRDTEPRIITLVRESIPVASVFGEWVEPGIARLRITHFHQHTHEEFQQQLQALTGENGSGVDGLLLDLRENLGGELQSAIHIADGFLEAGLVTETQSRYPATQLTFHAQPGEWLPGVPVAILVDALTASSSEVLAAALQDHGRALVVGAQTYGKGTVQSVMRLRNGSALRLTTARFYTPQGRSLQDQGIQPDIETADAAESEREALNWLKSKKGETGA